MSDTVLLEVANGGAVVTLMGEKFDARQGLAFGPFNSVFPDVELRETPRRTSPSPGAWTAKP